MRGLSDNHSITVNVSQVSSTDRFLSSMMTAWGIKSLLCVRTSSLENIGGLILLQHCDTDHKWTQEEMSFVDDVSTHVSTALAQAHLLEVEKAREIAEKANLAKMEFLAVVSHEVRTPMNGIIGMLNCLKESTLTEEQQECVNMMSASSKSLLELLNSLLDFSKLESERFELEVSKN
jgi:signal transduction histidine kinase